MNTHTESFPTATPFGEGEVDSVSRPSFSVRVDATAGFSADRINPIRHNLHQHSLLQLPRLAKLAHDLMPTKQCRFIRPGSTTQTSEFVHTPKTPGGQSIDDVFAHIDEPGTWLAMYNIQTDPDYRALIDKVIENARPHIETSQSGLRDAVGYIFMAAPPSVTPFHIDSENNFLMQICGHKRVTLFDHTDREVVPATAVEDFIVDRSLKNVRLNPELRSHGRDFDVGPGEGVYFPSPTPHMTETFTDWVRPGNGVSMSLSVVFYTSVTRRHARAHQCNRVLRRAGLNPSFPGQSPWRDRVKAVAGSAVAKTRVRFRDYVLPPGH